MMNKVVIIALFAFVAAVECGILPAAYISPYASTYNAHTINHAVATPIVHAGPAAKIIAAPSPYASPFASPYIAAPFASSPFVAASPYSSLPYSYNPYAYSNYFL